MRVLSGILVCLLCFGITCQSHAALDVTAFGARGDGKTDDTQALQLAVNQAVETGEPLYLPPGHYLLSPRGSFDVQYWGKIAFCLLVSNQSQFTLEFTGPGALLLPIADDQPANAIVFDRCTDFTVSGIVGLGLGVPRSLRLYTHYLALATGCERFTLRSLNATNLAGAAIAMNSQTGRIELSRSATAHTGKRGMHFGSLGGSFITVADCRAQGGTGDGDIFHFGSGAGNRIERCVAISIPPDGSTRPTGTQGIGIDSAQSFAVVDSCYAEGYYYGIDIKADSNDAVVSNNTLVGNKVGIAVRLGENPYPTYRAKVIGNTILPGYGNGHPTLPTGQASRKAAFGIVLQDAINCEVSRNFIGVDENQPRGIYRWSGIVVTSTSRSKPPGLTPADLTRIQSNTIRLKQKNRSGHVAESLGSAIYVEGSDHVLIDSNIIAVPDLRSRATPVTVKSVSSLEATNNVIKGNVAGPYLDVIGTKRTTIRRNAWPQTENATRVSPQRAN
jgi:hypothetical protein